MSSAYALLSLVASTVIHPSHDPARLPGAFRITVRMDDHDHHQRGQQTMSAFDINQLTISGNLTTDPELRHTTAGTALCRLRIAHNERHRLESGDWVDNPHYFDVTVWGRVGEWVGNHVGRGDRVVIAGRLRWREWQTQDGERRQAVDITADSIVPAPHSTSSTTSTADAAGDDDIAF
jgi:single stranded DNA-binding protein